MIKRYHHILIPLDGSPLAELALKDAFAVAELSQAEVTLLQIVPPIDHVIAGEAEHPIFVDQQWEAKKLLATDKKKFDATVLESLRRHVKAINAMTAKGMYFWDYGNAFLFEADRSGADIKDKRCSACSLRTYRPEPCHQNRPSIYPGHGPDSRKSRLCQLSQQ